MELQDGVDFHQMLMSQAYDEGSWDGGYCSFLDSAPTDTHRAAVLLGNFQYQTYNGGVQQWVTNRYHVGLDDLLNVLDDMLAMDADEDAPDFPLASKVKELVESIQRVNREYDVGESGEPEPSRAYGYSDNEREYENWFNALDPLTDEYYDLNDLTGDGGPLFMREAELFLREKYRRFRQQEGLLLKLDAALGLGDEPCPECGGEGGHFSYEDYTKTDCPECDGKDG